MKKSRLWMSGISILLVFCLLAGGTMAWFTDTEKVQGDFAAGVLDITLTPGEDTTTPLTFENLRPMNFDAFQAEINEAGNGNNSVEGYAPVPQYFQPVVIKNDGTLPVYIKVAAEALDMEKLVCAKGGEKKLEITVDKEGRETIKQIYKEDGETNERETCTNGLEEALVIVLFEKIDGKWTVVADNLNPATEGEPYEPGVVIPAATGEKTYVVGAYLPGETTGNAFQAKHFHGNLVVSAVQTDVGAGTSSTPSTPDTPVLPELAREITVEWTDHDANPIDSYKVQVTFPEGEATISFTPDTSKLPEGYVLDGNESATINRDTESVKFVTVELPELTKEITVEWFNDKVEKIGSYQAQVVFPRGMKTISFKPDTTTLPKGYALFGDTSRTIGREVNTLSYMAEEAVIIEPTDPLKEETKTINVRWYLGSQKGDVQEVLEIKTINVTFSKGAEFVLVKLNQLEAPEGYRWADYPKTIYDPKPDFEVVFRNTTQFDIRAEKAS